MRRMEVLYYFQRGGGLLPYLETHKTYIHPDKVQSIKDVLSHVLKKKEENLSSLFLLWVLKRAFSSSTPCSFEKPYSFSESCAYRQLLFDYCQRHG